jgi:hypothetical protein
LAGLPLILTIGIHRDAQKSFGRPTTDPYNWYSQGMLRSRLAGLPLILTIGIHRDAQKSFGRPTTDPYNH